MVRFTAKASKCFELSKDDNKSWDIQVYLHNLWLEKMATSSLYDDATILHGFYCHCCSRTVFLMEDRKHK